MSKCSCDKTACTYPECDDGPLPAPVWERVRTAAALANLADMIAGLLDRVETLEQTIKDMEADS